MEEQGGLTPRGAAFPGTLGASSSPSVSPSALYHPSDHHATHRILIISTFPPPLYFLLFLPPSSPLILPLSLSLVLLFPPSSSLILPPPLPPPPPGKGHCTDLAVRHVPALEGGRGDALKPEKLLHVRLAPVARDPESALVTPGAGDARKAPLHHMHGRPAEIHNVRFLQGVLALARDGLESLFQIGLGSGPRWHGERLAALLVQEFHQRDRINRRRVRIESVELQGINADAHHVQAPPAVREAVLGRVENFAVNLVLLCRLDILDDLDQ
eukprot:866124-Pyramimonas_sp.AAC.1